MTPLSIVMPFYRNGSMLARQYAEWAGWPADLKSQVDVVIVDDGSPEPALDVERPDGLPALAIFRVLEDKPWHQHGARNLGAHVAPSPFLLLTDMDHIIPADTLAEVLAAKDRGRVFTFGRRDLREEQWFSANWRTFPLTMRDDGTLKPHVNSFAMSRALFWKIGGYDEDYCGLYGTDQLFRTRLYRGAKHVHLDHAPLIRVPREVIFDASTRDVGRKEGREPGQKKAIARAKASRGEANVIRTLAFAWEQVYGADFHSRPIPDKPTADFW